MGVSGFVHAGVVVDDLAAEVHTPPGGGDREPALPNRPGIRHLAYAVDDLRAVVDRVRTAGWDTVGDVVDYEGAYLLCYVRGPEGLIFEPAERRR